jgi:hypothetical protein
VSPMKSNHQAASSARAYARQAVAQVKPLAQSTAAAASRRVQTTRAWAAPQLKHSGQVLEHNIAPKVAGLLSSAAQRLEPAKPRRERWRKLAGISMLTAAGSAVAAVILNRKKPGAAEADTDDATRTAEMRDGQSSAGADADANGRVRSS